MMRRMVFRYGVVVGVAAWLAMGVGVVRGEGEGGEGGGKVPPIQGFRLPEYDENGKLERQVFGETATFLQDGIIQLTGLQLEFFRDGELVVRARSPFCAYDRDRGRAASQEKIRIVADKALITGNGFAWNGENGQFQIFEDARLVIDNKRLDTGELLGAGGMGVGGGGTGGEEEEGK